MNCPTQGTNSREAACGEGRPQIRAPLPSGVNWSASPPWTLAEENSPRILSKTKSQRWSTFKAYMSTNDSQQSNCHFVSLMTTYIEVSGKQVSNMVIKPADCKIWQTRNPTFSSFLVVEINFWASVPSFESSPTTGSNEENRR